MPNHSHQIEYWARIGKAALENPDLPINLVQDILIARTQNLSLTEPFISEKS